MNPTLEDGLRALREASEDAKSIRVDLDDEYPALIAAVEARPDNQSGADKRWVWRLDRASVRPRQIRRTASVNPIASLVAALHERAVRFVLIGVAGANLYAPSGSAVFVTEDSDLFLPPDADNLVGAWAGAESVGLDLWTGDEPLDSPRDALEQLLRREDRD